MRRLTSLLIEGGEAENQRGIRDKLRTKHAKCKAMKLEVIHDSNGKTTGVYIPIRAWNVLKKKYKDLQALEGDDPTKAQQLAELKEGVSQLKQVEKGTLSTRPAQALLDEL